MTRDDAGETASTGIRVITPLSLKSTPMDAPAWIYPGAHVYDEVRDLQAVVTALGFPGGDPRQFRRAWVRPPKGGCEWNPFFDDLLPDPQHATVRRTT